MWLMSVIPQWQWVTMTGHRLQIRTTDFFVGNVAGSFKHDLSSTKRNSHVTLDEDLSQIGDTYRATQTLETKKRV